MLQSLDLAPDIFAGDAQLLCFPCDWLCYLLQWVAIPSPVDLPDPGIEPGSPHWRRILYQLSYQGSPCLNSWTKQHATPSSNDQQFLTHFLLDFFTEVYNVNFCCAAKWFIFLFSDSLYTFFLYGLSQFSSSLCYTVGPCCLAILYIS